MREKESQLKFSGKATEYKAWKVRFFAFLDAEDSHRLTKVNDENFKDGGNIPADVFTYQEVLHNRADIPKPTGMIMIDGTRAYANEDEEKVIIFHKNRFEIKHNDLRKWLLVAMKDVKIPQLSGDMVSTMTAWSIFEAIETNYANNFCTSMVDLCDEYCKVTQEWKTIGELWSKALRIHSELNSKEQDEFEDNLLSERFIIYRILNEFPRHVYANEIDALKRGKKLNVKNAMALTYNAFGGPHITRDQVKKAMTEEDAVKINAAQVASNGKRGKGRGKRNASALEDQSTKKKAKKENEKGCFYCFNKDHWKSECPTKKKDVSDGVIRKNVQSQPTEGSQTSKSSAINIVKDDDRDIKDLMDGMNEFDYLVRDYYKEYLSKLTVSDNCWLVDTGAGASVTGDREWLNQKNISNSRTFTFGSGTKLTSKYISSVDMFVRTPHGYDKVVIPDVSYVEGCTSNLISASAFQKDMRFISSRCGKYLYFFKGKKFRFAAVQQDGVYYLPTKKPADIAKILRVTTARNISVTKVLPCNVEDTMRNLHVRFNHVNIPLLKFMLINKCVEGLPFFSKEELNKCSFQCKICSIQKARRMSYKNMVGTRVNERLSTFHMDTAGPMKINGAYGNTYNQRYILVIICDYTSYKWVFTLKNKGEIPTKIKELMAVLERQFKTKVRRFRTDGGTEFVNTELTEYCKGSGIIFQKSNVECQEENGAAERAHQTGMSHVRCMLHQAQLNACWWPEALMYSTYVYNRTPMAKFKGKSPYEMLHGEKPNMTMMKVWGSICYAFTPVSKRTDKKLSPRADKCYFLGVSDDHKGFRLFNTVTKKVFISRDVKFDTSSIEAIIDRTRETLPTLSQAEEQEIQDLTKMSSSDTLHVNTKDNENAHDEDDDDRDSNDDDEDDDDDDDVITDANDGNGVMNDVSNDDDDDTNGSVTNSRPLKRTKRSTRDEDNYVYPAWVTRPSKVTIPTSITQALSGPNAREWKDAIQTEWDALVANGTWELVPRPNYPNVNVLGCHWILDVKEKPDGSIERYKARLVAQGNTQQFGIDYGEIFAPVARIETLRLILILANIHDYEIHQMDVSTAFLNGHLDEETHGKIFMRQPPGMICKGKENYVLRLKKSLYGLKQAPRVWYEHLSKVLIAMGFSRCAHDYCLYLKKVGVDDIVIIVVYVDDLTIAGSKLASIQQIKIALSSKFKMKDLGEINYMLKMQIHRNRKEKTIFINQTKYINEILMRFNMSHCVPVKTPQLKDVVLERQTKLTKEEVHKQSIPYREAIGSLQYLVRGSRPDLANVVRELSQYMDAYDHSHWSAVKRVLAYLKGTSMYGLVLKNNKDDKLKLTVYTDASFANVLEDRKSISGYATFVNNALLSWRSKKQECVSTSTAQAELIACSEGVMEMQWITHLLKELGFVYEVPQVNVDNKSTIAIIKNPGNHKATKHVETRYLYVRDIYNKKELKLEYCKSSEMIADVFTKALGTKQFCFLCNLLGVTNLNGN